MIPKNELHFKVTPIFDDNLAAYEAGNRYILNQGGSRSSKTWSLLQLMVYLCFKQPGIYITIVRKTLPSLRDSSMGDFFEIIKELNLYKETKHNMTQNIYEFDNGSQVKFLATIDGQNLRGKKRDILYINEANEISYDEYIQLALRTTGTIFLDFNPSDTEHFIYEIIKQPKSILIKSTYKDNTFLGQNQIDEIEGLINTDENYYKIYALGERPIARSRIYNHFKLFSDKVTSSDWCYGLDFGYNHHSGLVKTTFIDNKVYIEELLYENQITVNDLCTKIRELISDNKPIYCDSARPDIIAQLKTTGLNAYSSNKSVKEGIDSVKSAEIFVEVNSINLLKEYRLYSWKMDGQRVLDEPVKLWDDILDATRYAIHSHKVSNKAYNPKRTQIRTFKF
jgi:phage terminase large subunit